MKNKLAYRIVADIVMVAFIAWAPIWIVVPAAVAASWVFAPFYEIIFIGFVWDALYGFHSFKGMIVALFVFLLIEIFKRRSRI